MSLSFTKTERNFRSGSSECKQTEGLRGEGRKRGRQGEGERPPLRLREKGGKRRCWAIKIIIIVIMIMTQACNNALYILQFVFQKVKRCTVQFWKETHQLSKVIITLFYSTLFHNKWINNPGNKEGGNKVIRIVFQARKVATEKDPTDLNKIITWNCVFSDESEVKMCGFSSIWYWPNKKNSVRVTGFFAGNNRGNRHLHDIKKLTPLLMAKLSFHLEGQTSDKQQQVPDQCSDSVSQ